MSELALSEFFHVLELVVRELIRMQLTTNHLREALFV